MAVAFVGNQIQDNFKLLFDYEDISHMIEEKKLGDDSVIEFAFIFLPLNNKALERYKILCDKFVNKPVNIIIESPSSCLLFDDDHFYNLFEQMNLEYDYHYKSNTIDLKVLMENVIKKRHEL